MEITSNVAIRMGVCFFVSAPQPHSRDFLTCDLSMVVWLTVTGVCMW